jgi:hypothetical protein
MIVFLGLFLEIMRIVSRKLTGGACGDSLPEEIVNAPAPRRRACSGTNGSKHSNAIAQASALRVAVFTILYLFLC